MELWFACHLFYGFEPFPEWFSSEPLSDLNERKYMLNQWINTDCSYNKVKFDQFIICIAYSIYMLRRLKSACWEIKSQYNPLRPVILESYVLLQEEKGIISLNTCPTSAVSITCLTSFKQSGKNRKVSPDVFWSQSNLKRMRLDFNS